MDFDLYVGALERARNGRGPENLIVLPRVGSTNELARSIVTEYDKEAQELYALLVLAFEQTGGRGRRGRSWSSPRGKGVYATRVLTVPDPQALPTLPLLVGAGLCRALAPHLSAPCRLKWPNDLLVETEGRRRKIGGVLIEALIRTDEPSAALIGFGVNQGHEAGDMPETATSLRLEAGPDLTGPTLAELTWDLVGAVEAELTHLGDSGYAVAAYRELSVHQPGERLSVAAGEEVVEGTFVGIDDQGSLLLTSGGQERRFSAGEIIER